MDKELTYDELQKQLNELKEFVEGLTSITLPFKIPGVEKDLTLECLVSLAAAKQIKQIAASIQEMHKKKEDEDKDNENKNE